MSDIRATRVLVQHLPIYVSLGGPISGCECGAKLPVGSSFAAHVVAELRAEGLMSPPPSEELAALRRGRAAALYEAARAEYGVIRWEDPLPVPEWVYAIRAALGAPREDDGGLPDLAERRAYHARKWSAKGCRHEL